MPVLHLNCPNQLTANNIGILANLPTNHTLVVGQHGLLATKSKSNQVQTIHTLRGTGTFPSVQQIISKKQNLDAFSQILVYSPKAMKTFLSHGISKENDKKNAILPMSTSLKCLHPHANMRMTQKFQRRIPNVAFVVFIGFRRRERRSVVPIHCEPGSETSESTEPNRTRQCVP